MRDQVRTWLEELGHRPEDATNAERGDDWAWKIVMPPHQLEVLLLGRTSTQEVTAEAFHWFGLEALGTRQGPDIAHRLRAAMQRREPRDVEVELHRNGKAWLRSALHQSELTKDALAERLAALQTEQSLLLEWVAQAVKSGALPPSA